MIIEKRADYKPSNVHTLNDVESALIALSQDLPAEKIDRVSNFNNTYLVITRRVKKELSGNTFAHPEFLQHFDTVFADYYLSALKGYVTNQTIPEAWYIALEKPASHEVSHFISMALGVNAHVNNDIAQVLIDCNAQPKHRKDFYKINSIIASSVYEVIDGLDNDHNFFGPQNMIFTKIYKTAMVLLIHRWRYTAWKNYEKLFDKKITVADIEKKAATKANILAKLPV